MIDESKQIEFSERDRKVQSLIIIEGCANLLVLMVKLLVGLSTGSLAILADAIHSLTDLANNFVAWIVVRVSALPADREHPYGHRKFETLAVFALATLLVVMAIEIVKNAFTRDLIAIASGTLEFVLMIGVLVVNILLAAWQRFWARRLKSSIMLADATHTFADILTTVVVIIGWQLSSMGFLMLDRLCALGVAMLVFHLAYRLYKSAFPVLVDEYAIDPEAIKKAVLAVQGVAAVGRIRTRWIGSEIAIDIVVCVDAALSTKESHRIADQVESRVAAQFNVGDALIHIEPY